MLHSKASKFSILAAVCLLGIGATCSAHAAVTWTFDFTNADISWTVPETGIYDITAFGAGGGAFVYGSGGGLGAEIGGNSALTAGQTLTIVVGGEGGSGSGGGGGGGTYVVLGGAPLVIAGGGGGGGYDGAGGNGLTGKDGGAGGDGGGPGGVGGAGGGGAGLAGGGGGGGFSGAGGDAPNGGLGGDGFPGSQGGYGACVFQGLHIAGNGGFGGGGGGGCRGAAFVGGGGGGGGFSGGGGGAGSEFGGGGGGGSYLASFATELVAFPGQNSGDGLVTIAGVPEPSTWAMMLLGFVGLGFVGYRWAMTFDKKLNKLVALGKVGADERDGLDVLANAGGAAAHRGWKPTPTQLATMMGALEQFLSRTFVLDAEIKKLKNEVPKKPKRQMPLLPLAKALGKPA